MSYSSRAYSVLRSLYRGVLSRQRIVETRAVRQARCRKRSRAPHMEPLEERALLAADLSSVGAGLNSFLPELETQVIGRVFSTPVPGYGDSLSTKVPGEIFNSLQDALSDFDAGAAPTVDDIRVELAEELELFLEDGISSIDVFGTDGSAEIQFEFTISSETTFEDALDFDFGLGDGAVLQALLDTENQVDVTIGYEWKLKFGVSEIDGFFIDAGLEDELTIDVIATIDSNFEVFGKFGIMPTTFTEFVPTIPTPDTSQVFEGTYEVDVTSDRDESRLLASESFARVSADAVLTGEAVIQAHAEGGVLPAFLDLAGIGLPIDDLFDLKFSADVKATIEFERDDVNAETFGDEDATVEFLEVMLDVDSFIESFLEPIILDLQSVLIPLNPVFDFLSFEIPVLSDIIDEFDIDLGLDFSGDSVFEEQDTQSGKPKLKLTTLDLILAIADTDKTKKEGKEKLKRAFTVLDAIRTYQERDKTAGDRQMEMVGSYSTSASGGVKQKTPAQELNKAVKKKFVSGGVAGNKVKSINNDVAFPFLESPEQVFNVLLGNDGIDLFTFNTEVAFDTIWTGFVPLYMVLGLTLRFEAGFDINFGAGYQSDGINDFLRTLDYSSTENLVLSASNNVERLKGGLFFDDHNSSPQDGDRVDANGDLANLNDKPEFKIGVALSPGLALGLDIGIARAFGGVGGGVEVNFEFDLNDLPDPEVFLDTSALEYDGKVTLEEAELILPSGFDNLFNISFVGQAFIELFLTVEGGIKPVSFKLLDLRKKWVTPPIFSVPVNTPSDADILNGDFTNDTVLAELNETDGTVTLLVGARGGDRSPDADPSATVETYTIRQLSYDESTEEATLLVTAFNRVQIIEGAKRIQGDFGTGNDEVTVYGGTRIEASLDGGEGNDVLLYRGRGKGILSGGEGDDELVGGLGDDEITGGLGNDTLFGGAGNDLLNGGNDNDELLGGDGEDELLGGEGDDVLHGGDDNDLLFGSSGDDRLYGDLGNDSLFGDAGLDYLEGGQGDDILEGGDDDDSFLIIVSEGIDVVTDSGTTNISGDRLLVQGEVVFEASDVDNNLPILTRVEAGDSIGLSRTGTDVLLATQAGSTAISGVEAISLALGGGADTVTMGDLAGTDLDRLDLVFLEDGSIDAEDTLIVNGSEADDTIIARRGNVPLIDESGVPLGVQGVIPSVEISGLGPQATIYSPTIKDRLVLNGNGGNDTLQRGTLNPTPAGLDDDPATAIQLEIHGGAGNDVITAVNPSSAGGALLRGGEGMDTITGGRGSDTIFGDGGNDKIFGAPDELFNNLSDVIFGGAGNDEIYGTNNPDKISGDAGDDMIFAGAGADTIYGGADNDTIDAGFGDDLVFGDDGDDDLFGGDDGPGGANGFDKLFGGEGDDTLRGRMADSLLDGGAGINTMTFDTAINVANPTLAPTVHLGSNVVTVNFDGSRNSTGFLNAGASSVFTINLEGANRFFVNGSLPVGKTVINGGINNTAGPDNFDINSTSGELEINSGGGADTYRIDGTNDLVTINGGDGTDTVSILPEVNEFTNSPTHADVRGNVVFNGDAGADVIRFIDTGTGSFDATSGAITETSFSGFTLPEGIEIGYSNLARLDIQLGRANDTVVIEGTSADTTDVQTGFGLDDVEIFGFSNTLTVDGQGGAFFTTGTDFDRLTLGSTALTATAAAGNSLNAAAFESIRVDDSTETNNTDWIFTGNHVTKDGNFVLDYTPGEEFLGVPAGEIQEVALIAGTGDDTITILNNTVPIDVDGGLGTDTITISDLTSNDPLLNHEATITVSGGSDATADKLVVDFSGNVLRSNDWDWDLGQLTIANRFPELPLAQPLSIVMESEFEDVLLEMGNSGSHLDIHDTFRGDMRITASIDADFVTVQGVNTLSNLFLELGDGNNQLTIGGSYRDPVARNGEPIAGQIAVTGDGRLELDLDRSFDRLGREGTIGSAGISGLGMGDIDLTGIHVQSIKALLGTGADIVEIADTATLFGRTAKITVDGNFGNDSLTAVVAGLQSVNQQSMTLRGGPGRDTTAIKLAEVAVEAPNLTDTQDRPNLVFDSEVLVVDNQTGAVGVNWTLTDDTFNAEGLFIADARFVDQVILQAGTSGADAFTVERAGDTPLNLLIDGQSVSFIRDPSTVLAIGETVSLPGADTTPLSTTPDIESLLISPNDNFVYAISRDRDGIIVYPRDASFGDLGFPEEVTDTSRPISVLRASQAIAVSPDGEDVYVAASLGLIQLERDPNTGLLDLEQRLENNRNVIDLAISQDGQFVFALVNRIGAETGINTLVIYNRNSTTGALSEMQSLVLPEFSSFDSLEVSPDGINVYVTSDVNDSLVVIGKDLAADAFEHLETLDVENIKDVAISPDGEFAYSVNEGAMSVFSRNDDGTLNSLTVFNSVNIGQSLTPTSVTVSPGNESIYVTSENDNSIVRFTRDLASGVHAFNEVTQSVASGDPTNITVSADGTRVYVVSSDADEVTVLSRDTDGSLTSLDSQSGENLGLDHVQAVAVSPDGSHIYTAGGDPTSGVPVDGAVSVFGQDGTDDLFFLDALIQRDTLNRGLIDPAAAVQSHDGNHLYVAATGERGGSIAVYDTLASSGLPRFEQIIFDNLPGMGGLTEVTNIVVSPDDRFVYVASSTDGMITVFERNDVSGELTKIGSTVAAAESLTISPNGMTLYVGGSGEVLSLARNLATGSLGAPAIASNLVAGEIDSLAVSFDGMTLVAASEDQNRLFIFDRAVDGTLSLVETFIDGVGGVDGLAGVAAVVFSPDGQRIHGTGADDNSVVIFDLDSDTGQWTFVGRIELSQSTQAGPPSTIAISSDGAHAYVARGAVGEGAITLLSPPKFDVQFSNTESLTVKTGDGDDVLALVNPAENVEVTLDAGNGNNQVAINDTAAPTSVISGTGRDDVELLSTGSDLELTVSTGSGEDAVNLWGAGKRAELSIDLGDDADAFRYASDELANANNNIALFGGSPSSFPGDEIIGESGVYVQNPSLPTAFFPSNGLHIVGNTVIQYFGFEFPGILPQPTFDAPSAVAANQSISEGDSLALDGSASTAGDAPLSTYEWDLNSDGIFGDVLGDTATLTWTQLAAFGVDDDGVYSISLRVTDVDGLIDVTTASLTVLNTAPAATISGVASVDEGNLYTLNLSVTDPGDDVVEKVIVNWGDGIVETLDVGLPLTHSYADGPATHIFSVEIVDEDGTHSVANTLEVEVFDVAPQLSIAGESTVDEGEPYLLFLNVDGDPGQDTITEWNIDWGDGSPVLTIAVEDILEEGFVSHVYGATSPTSTFEISATATDEDGTHTASNTIVVEVTDVPDKTLLLSIAGDDTVDEGTIYSLNLISDAPAADPILSWTVDWGDGSDIEVIGGSPASVTHVYVEQGVYEIVATAIDSDGPHPVEADNPFTPEVETDPYFVTVLDIAPTATIDGPTQVDEGSVYTLNLTTFDSGPDNVTGWSVDWGDGSVDTIIGNPESATHIYADGTQNYEITASAQFTQMTSDGPIESTVAADAVFTVTVNNVAPTLRLVGETSTDEGSLYELYLAASDLGTDEISHWIIDWGDDTVETVFGNPNSVGHEYTDGTAVYTISAIAFDEDSPLSVSTEALSLNWNAADPGDNPITAWTPDAGNGIDWILNDVTLVNGVATGTGVTDVYEFTGSSQAVANNSFANFADTTAAASFEFWIKPDDLDGQEILFEAGGSANGISLRLDGDGVASQADRLILRVKDQSLILETEVELFIDEFDEFAQVMATVQTGTGSDAVISLYVDGVLRSSMTAAPGQLLTSWADVDGDALGGFANEIGGSNAPAGNGDLEQAGFGRFQGQLATLRFYDSALKATQVAANYAAVQTVGLGTPSLLPGEPDSGYTVSGVSQFTLPIKAFSDGTLDSLRFYLPNSTPSEWKTAQAEAVSWGGNLVWINSQNEQDFLDQNFLSSADAYWIGLTNVADPLDPTDFQWTSGATFGFSNFALGEPDDGGDFVFIQNQDNGNSNWFDSPDTVDRLGIIKLTSLNRLPASAFSATTSDVTVNNVAPELTISGARMINEGDQYSLTLELLNDPGDETDFQFIIDWGDGNIESFDFDPESTVDGVLTSLPAAVIHQYADGPEDHTITVDVIDDDGTYVGLASLDVDVLDVAPKIDLLGTVSINEGLPYTLTLSEVIDPGIDTATQYLVNWGDGSPIETFLTAGDVTHVYSGGGVQRTITVDLINEDGFFTAAGQKTIFIDDVTLVIDLTGNANVDEGNSYTLDFGAISDPSDPEGLVLPEVTQFVVRWGDGTVETLPADTTSTIHTFSDGDFTHGITVDLVTDTAGTFRQAGVIEVVVNNVAPIIDPLIDVVLLPGQSLTRGGTFSDPGIDTATATVDYGEGSGPVALPLRDGDTFLFNNHYENDGEYTVVVAVTDEDGDTGIETFQVLVTDAVTVSIDDVTVNESAGTATFTVQLSDILIDDVIVSFATTNGTAVSGGVASIGQDDYTAAFEMVTVTAGNLSAPITIVINNDDVFEPEETFSVQLTGVETGNAAIADNIGTGSIVSDDDLAVREFLVSSDAWSDDFLRHIDPDHRLGYAIPVDTPEHLVPLPWVNVNEIHLTFNGDVEISPSDVELFGVNVPTYGFSDFSYDSSTFTATWTLADLLSSDRLLLNVADAVVADTEFALNILPGDVNASSNVTVTDLVRVAGQVGKVHGAEGYLAELDINGSGDASVTDLSNIGARINSSLPVGMPVNNRSAAAALVAEDQVTPNAIGEQSFEATFVSNAVEADASNTLVDTPEPIMNRPAKFVVGLDINTQANRTESAKQAARPVRSNDATMRRVHKSSGYQHLDIASRDTAFTPRGEANRAEKSAELAERCDSTTDVAFAELSKLEGSLDSNTLLATEYYRS